MSVNVTLRASDLWRCKPPPLSSRFLAAQGVKAASASKLVIMNPGKAAAFVNPMIFSDADIVVPVFNRGKGDYGLLRALRRSAI